MSTVRNRLLISFVAAWIAYALTYFLRKPLGVIKADLEHELSFTKFQLGLFDTALLLPYALVQTFFGSLGDRYGARRTFGYGLIGSGISMITFGWWNDYRLFLLLLFFNGAFQSLCWAAANKGLGAWVTDIQRNFVFGLFGTCPFAGGILGTALAVYIQGTDGWRLVHFQPSIYCILAGILVLVLFREPSELKMLVTGKESAGKSSETRARMTIMEVYRLPMVKEIAASVFCLKVVRYAIYLWLPLYLKQELSYSKKDAGLFSTMFDIGGVAGSATIGYVLKRFFNNEGCLGAGVETLFSAGTLILFLAFSQAGVTINSILMMVTGALNCGADIILCSSVPIEIGEMDGRNAGSAVIGFVNGVGSIGTFLEGPVIGWIVAQYGWSAMFTCMILLSIIGALTSFRAARYQRMIKLASTSSSFNRTTSCINSDELICFFFSLLLINQFLVISLLKISFISFDDGYIPKMLLPPTPSAADLLRTYKLPALRRFAQNFLLDPRATSKFVACAGNIENKFVIEVGPGPGGITRKLFEHGAARVAAIEKDIRLFPALQTLANAVDSRLQLYLGDILDFNIESVIPDDITVQHGSWESDESSSSTPIHLVGNLPFNIAIPLLIRWLKQVSTRSGPFSFGYRIPITICMQEAVAGRIVSSPLLDQRGRLSIIFQNWFDCRVKHVFSGRAFVPGANVNVAVMQLIPLKRPLINVDYDLLDKVTRAAFHTRNKKMSITMAPLFREETRDEDLKELFHRSQLKPATMCLTLTVEEFGHLAQIYGEIISRPRPIHEQIDQKINQKELTFELGETYVRPEKLKTKKKSKKDWDE